MKRIGGALAVATIALVAACTDAELKPTQLEPPPPLDDQLTITGTICTERPRDELFPVKVMLVVDTSNSLQFTDPGTQRVTAVEQLLDRYAGNPAVSFSVIAFDAVVSDLTRGFTPSPDASRIASRLSNADRLTDYQGALGAAYSTLAADMRATSPIVRARTKYVILFFSDGTPDPQCAADEPAMFENVCTVDREDWPDEFVLPEGRNPNTGKRWTWEEFQGLYPELEAGKDYNTEPQLLAKVRDLVELADVYNANEVRFHTAFLFDPTLAPAVRSAFGLDRDRGVRLLSAMASEGGGTFAEFTSGGEVTFLNVSYTSLEQPYAMTNLLAVNRSAPPFLPRSDPVADSDADGLSDDLEHELRLCAYGRGGPACAKVTDPADTDGDGYRDLFEHRFRASGFDPAEATPSSARCTNPKDSDGDDLLDCEEAFLGTDPRLFDGDLDRLPDGLEVRFGLDPTERDDARADADSDAVLDGEEIAAHRDPRRNENGESRPYRYRVSWREETADGRNCYEYAIERVQLVTTRSSTAAERGKNRIELHFLEGLAEDPRDFGLLRTACVEATFIAPDLKRPEAGALEVRETDFTRAGEPRLPCVGAAPAGGSVGKP